MIERLWAIGSRLWGGRAAPAALKDVSFSYHDLSDACDSDGCPVCSVAEEQERRFVESLFYEKVNDPGVRRRLRDAGGICPRHLELLLRMGDLLGLTILVDDVLDHAAGHLAEGKAGRCFLCPVSRERQENLTATLAAALAGQDFWKKLEVSPGLCLRHFQMTYARVKSPLLRKQLLEWELRKLRRQKEKAAAILARDWKNGTGVFRAQPGDRQVVERGWRLLRL